MGVSPADDGSTAEPDYSGSSTYVRFDVPKLKIKRSWPGIKGKDHKRQYLRNDCVFLCSLQFI